MVQKKRYAVVEVQASMDWLTSYGEETEESGWDEVAKNLTNHLRGFNRFGDASLPVAKFIEWDEDVPNS